MSEDVAEKIYFVHNIKHLSEWHALFLPVCLPVCFIISLTLCPRTERVCFSCGSKRCRRTQMAVGWPFGSQSTLPPRFLFLGLGEDS